MYEYVNHTLELIFKMDLSSLVLNALATPLTLCSFDLFVATIKWRTFSLKDYLNQPSIIFVANCCLALLLSA